ncbi:MAG TPA: helix-turn-helix domain-containing protein [Blastocatellia bacterium]|nr:helix-turn-helix domain-containing protein [Blastocatellia bacterium]
MSEQVKAERDRLKLEQDYLMGRVIETNLNLQSVLAELRETFSGLQALEKIKLLKASELAELFQVSDNRIYELVRTRGLPAIPLGDHQLRFDPIAVRRWLDEGGRELIGSESNESQKDNNSSLQIVNQGL